MLAWPALNSSKAGLSPRWSTRQQEDHLGSRLFAAGRGTTIALAIALTIARAGVADAATIPGWLGKPTLPADVACFDQNGSSFGSVHSICGGTKFWDMPLHIDSSVQKSHTVVVNVQVSRQVCTLYGVTNTGVVVSSFSNSPGPQLPVLTVNVPASGTMRLVCNLNLGDEVISVLYN